ncbi:MAG: relaxase/mobilization nuclease domain-containing protein [Candidatus Thiodiazotropha endolucinida]
MILKGNQRGGAKQLALHLLNTQTNDHVEIHEIRGFVSDSLQSALHEAYAISRGTKCQKFLFSVSLSPPETEDVPVEEFEKAANDIEKKLGLNNQSRAIVFHEKEGRRHAHCVWSRIDTEKMRAIELPYYKNRLRDVSKQLWNV